MRYRGVKRIHCPETGGWVDVHLDTRHAMLTALEGAPTLRVARCSRWPERPACGQDCLREPQNQLTLHSVQGVLEPFAVRGRYDKGE